jgi:hypothetical protein
MDGAWRDQVAVTVVMASDGYPGDYPTGHPITHLDDAERRGCLVFHAGTKWADERLDRGGFDEAEVMLLADAQTSGGLVFGVDPTEVDGVLADLDSTGHAAAVIGRATAGSGRITLA